MRTGRPAITDVVVVIPARNEAALIGTCLDAITVAAAALKAAEPHGGVAQSSEPSGGSGAPRVHTIVVLDSCTDQTGEVAASYPDVVVICVDVARVGSTRATGIAAGLFAAGGDPTQIWIANSDADSVVPVNWLTQQLRFADAGADLVLGTVRPVLADMNAGQAIEWQLRHPHGSPIGSVHGANLGVRGSSYLEAGGFAAVTEHEDVDLTARLRASGARVVETDSIIVMTSGRSIGRTPGGYASYVQALNPVRHREPA